MSASIEHGNLFARACRVIPGGVNSPVRAFNGVGGTPAYVLSGEGARISMADGREMVDFCCSWGAMILGHAHPEIVESVRERAARGTTFGINTPEEVELAERLCALVPGMDRVRLVNSGTEAVMTALRLARGVTGRDKIVKFDGCYHGHGDNMLVAAGSGLLTGGVISSQGVPAHVASDTFVVPYNDIDALTAIVQNKGSEVAAIIVEPVAGNMGVVMPQPGFLEGLRQLADSCGALLILDEVITGFRFGLTTYGSAMGIAPDLVTLGKVIGGGLPLAAVGGRAELMEKLSPMGPVYQAGTLSGNPLAVVAGLKTLEILERDDPYPRMAALGQQLREYINTHAADRSLPLHCAAHGGMFTIFFHPEPVPNLACVKQSDTRAFAAKFHELLAHGFYLPPSQFEAGFISAAHTEEDVTALAQAVLE